MSFETVGIVGVGLIGGSLGQAMSRRSPPPRVVGFGRDPARLRRARELGAIHEWSTEPSRLEECDLVVLALPVDRIVVELGRLSAVLRPGATVTDVGSTKRVVCAAAAESLPTGIRFVGGHPIAGRELTGVEHASPTLFEGAPWILCAERGRSDDAAPLRVLLESLGARVRLMDPEEHDRLLARISHVPQLLSSLLAAGLEDAPMELAGGGLKSMTRLAGSSYSVWQAVLETNLDNIDRELESLGESLQSLRESLARKGGCAAVFDRAARAYRRLFGEPD